MVATARLRVTVDRAQATVGVHAPATAAVADTIVRRAAAVDVPTVAAVGDTPMVAEEAAILAAVAAGIQVEVVVDTPAVAGIAAIANWNGDVVSSVSHDLQSGLQ